VRGDIRGEKEWGERDTRIYEEREERERERGNTGESGGVKEGERVQGG
jgi:hypothetical protein